MAKEQPPQKKPANLSVEQMKAALPKLDRRIADLKAFDVNSVQRRFDPVIEVLQKKVNSTLQDILGCESVEYQEYVLPEFDSLITFYSEPSLQAIKSHYGEWLDKAVKQISALKELFEERIADAEALSASSVLQPSPYLNTGKVFIVHGHDHGVKETVARFIEKLGLEPVILHEQPNENRTVIEKLEDHSEADFAIVLFTPDDIGYPAKRPEEAKPRARQNVVLELGYFMGKLGRKRVALLQVGDDIEIPSDYSGVLYLPYDDIGAWKFQLAREMKARGMDVDMNRV